MNDADWNTTRIKIGGLWPSAKWGSADSALRKLFVETLRPMDYALLDAALDEVRKAQSWHQPELRWIVEAYRRRRLAAMQNAQAAPRPANDAVDGQTLVAKREAASIIASASPEQIARAKREYETAVGKIGAMDAPDGNDELLPHHARIILAGLIRHPLTAAKPQN